MAHTRKESEHKSIVFAVWFIDFLSVGNMKAVGVLLPSLQDHFQTYTRTIGTAVSLLFISGSFIAILVEPLTRFYSIRCIIVISGLLSTIGLMICSLATNTHVLVFGLFLAGFTNICLVMALGALSVYFHKYYHMATSIVTSALPFGVIIFSVLTQYLVDSYGWRGTMALLAAIQFHSIPAGLVLKPIQQKDEPSKDENQNLTKQNNFFGSCFRNIFKLSLVQNRPFIVIAIAHSFLGYAENGWIVFFVSFSLSKGLTLHQAAFVVFFSGIGCFITRILLAIFPSDKYNRYLLYIGSVIMAAAYVGMYMASTYATLSIQSCLFGIGSGIEGTLLYIAMNACVNQQDIYGAMAVMTLTESSAYLLCGFVTGWLFDLTGSFNLSLITLGLVSALIFVILGVEDLFLKFCLPKDRYIPLR